MGEITITERIVATDKGPPNAAGSDVIPGCLFKTDLLGACSSHGYSFSAMRSTDRTIPVREELSIYICGVLVFSPCFVMLCLMFCGVLVMLTGLDSTQMRAELADIAQEITNGTFP